MIWKRSQRGFTRCPSCGAHVRAADTPAETECTFCNLPITDAAPRKGLSGRGSLVAASLVGLTSAACSGADESAPPPQTADPDPVVTSPDPEPEPDPHAGNDGNPPAWDPAPPDDNAGVAEYGVVPQPDLDVVVPMYGIAPGGTAP